MRAGLSLQQTADLLKMSARSLHRYDNGDQQPSALAIKTLRQAAETRGVPACGTQRAFTFVDLFAGIGGLRRGFESIGGHCVFTSEWDRHAQETYQLNFRDNHPPAGDIRPFSAEPDRVPDHDVLLAGFPCQPFSIAGVSKKNALGRPHGFLCDTQGTLFHDTAKIIGAKRPAAFLLENVKNLERHDGGRTFATVMNVLRNELKYDVTARIISSEAWVPQRRERIFIVGFREPTGFDLNALELPDPASGPKLGSILDPHEEVDPKYTLTPRLWEYLKAYRAKHALKGNGFGYSVFGPDDVTRTLSARYYKDGSEILVDQPGSRPRRLTPRECARLMGFETKERPFILSGSDTQAYRQFGNSVVVPVIEFVAAAMRPHIEAGVSRGEAQAAVSPDRVAA
ncbi:MAG: DNA (cytosine-5-)-methyltransferase [Caulobacteraceae bacterium]|nr:DNA (cytosine-5-)-methyltransferase [Caulobacteraceae bacterium]